MAQAELEKKVELNWLMAFYGPLLTEKQREALHMHCEEDLSLGEIAAEAGSSRQAVYDLLSRAARQLFDLEEKLHMAARFSRMQQGLEECQAALEQARYDDAAATIRSLIALDQEDGNGL